MSLKVVFENCSLPNYRHPCMRCDASSDDRATALPVIYICSHSDLSSLISMARMQSAQRNRKKRFVPRPGIEPGTFHLPGGCSTTKLPRPCTFCAVLSVLYCFTIIHGWGGCIVAGFNPWSRNKPFLSSFEHSAFLAMLTRLDKSKWEKIICKSADSYGK